MELERLLENTQLIQAIPAPTFGEAERAKFLQAKFHDSGLDDVEIDSIGNLYGRVSGGDSFPVIVSAHLDSVFHQGLMTRSRRTNDRLIGPGVGDNAVALAALIEFAQDLKTSPLPGDVWLVANVGEEGLGNLIGMREIVARFGDQVSAYIVIEGMALGHVYHRGLSVRRYRITARSRGGHSWIHAGRESALHTLLEVGAALTQLPLSSRPRTTLNIGKAEGGISINSIAHHAALEIDLRSEDPETLERLANDIEALAASFETPGVRIDLKEIGRRPGGDLPANHPLVRAACLAYKRAGERQAKLEMASSDANYPLGLGLPAICVGLTYGGEAHSLGEYIEITPVSRGYHSVLSLIRAAFRLDQLESR